MLNRKILLRTVLPVFLPPLLASAVIRMLLYSSWLDSPFRYYHTVPGLDMQTHMMFAEQFIRGNSALSNFSIYKLIISCSRIFNGGAFSPESVIVFQHFLGVLCALMTSYICLKLFGNRGAAALAGVAYALYGTTLSYECFILSDSLFSFLVLLSLFSLFICRKRRSSPAMMALSGAALALPLLVRFHGLLWTALSQTWLYLYNHRKYLNGENFSWKKSIGFILWPMAGTIAVFAMASIYNLYHGLGACPMPTVPNFGYVAQVGSTLNIKSLSSPAPLDLNSPGGVKSAPLTAKLKNYAEKFVMIFHHYEVPDNINCYFVYSALWPLKFSIGSRFLLPLALIGMFMIMLRQKTTGKCSILFVHMISFAVPLVLFVPLSRYRIVFVPVFCVFAAYPLAYLCEKMRKSRIMLAWYAAAAVALLMIMYPGVPDESHFRSEDFTAFARVLESRNADAGRVEELYRTAFLINPDSLSTAIHYSNFLMKNAKFADAADILAVLHENNPSNSTVTVNYASSLLGSGKPADAEKILLENGEPENRDSKVKYLYQLGESRRLQGRTKDAAATFKKAISFSDSDAQKRIIGEALRLCGEK